MTREPCVSPPKVSSKFAGGWCLFVVPSGQKVLWSGLQQVGVGVITPNLLTTSPLSHDIKTKLRNYRHQPQRIIVPLVPKLFGDCTPLAQIDLGMAQTAWQALQLQGEVLAAQGFAFRSFVVLDVFCAALKQMEVRKKATIRGPLLVGW